MVPTASRYAHLDNWPSSATKDLAASAACQSHLSDCRDLRARIGRLHFWVIGHVPTEPGPAATHISRHIDRLGPAKVWFSVLSWLAQVKIYRF